MGKKIPHDRLKQKFIKHSTNEGGGTLKVFGDELNPSIPYKTFLLSVKDTAEWIVKEMLEQYGLKHENPQNYCLLQTIIPSHSEIIKEVILHDKECPLNIYLTHLQKHQGTIVFKVIPCPLEYTEIRKRFRAQESAFDIMQNPSIEDRTIIDRFPMLIEVNHNGTELPTPRVYKLYPNIIYVGRDTKVADGKSYSYIDGIDHCVIQNQNNLFILIPRDEISLNGKLISTPFILQHGVLICCRQNSTFRYYDPQFIQKMQKKQQNGYDGLTNQQKEVSPTTVVDSGTKINVLPGLLEVSAETEVRFLHAVLVNYPLSNIHFRLSPVYTFIWHCDIVFHHMQNPHDDVEWNLHNQERLTHRSSTDYHQLTLNNILVTLSSIMDLLRKCRVNATFTIQIFSHIFHYIDAWLFNRIVCFPELKLCSYAWGGKFLVRLKSISNWAESQGLELAAECYLIKVNQLCLLLQSPKRDMFDVQRLISNRTFMINSIQITQILNSYIFSRNETPISNNFRQALLSVAYTYVDENLHREGCIIQLAEEEDLNLPFLLPSDGYTCENLRGIPQQLFDFIEPMNRLGLCCFFTHPLSLGMWTEFMQKANIENNRIETIILNKKRNNVGLSIVSAKSASQQVHGIYIKGIIPASAAADDGRLQPGDQILSVDKISFIDLTKEQAVQILKQSGPSIIFQILKNAATHHGLSALLSTPSNSSHDLAHSMSASNPSLISYEYSPSTLALQNINNSEPSHPNLYNSKQPFDNHQTNSVRSISPTHSLFNRNISTSKPRVFREDIPSNQNKNHRAKSVVVPRTLPKPMINTTASLRQINSMNDADINSQSLSEHSIPLRRKSRVEQQEPIKLFNTNETHVKRINDLISQLNRAEKQLNYLKSDHRVEEYHYQTNGNNEHQMSLSSLDDYDEKLKRRLEQFEQEREIERAYNNQILAKREVDIVENLRKSREREIRADRDMLEFKTRQMSKDDQILKAKKEQTRLLKHINRPKKS